MTMKNKEIIEVLAKVTQEQDKINTQKERESLIKEIEASKTFRAIFIKLLLVLIPILATAYLTMFTHLNGKIDNLRSEIYSSLVKLTESIHEK